MASRSKRGRSTTRKAPWDSLNPANWTATQLREKLEEMGVHMPQGMTKATLKSVYLENVGRDRSRPASGRRGSHARGRAVMDAPVTTVPIVNNVMDSGEYNSNVERSNSRDGTSSAEELHSSAEQPQSASNCSATTDYIPARQQELMTSTTNMAAPTMQEFMTAMQAMQHTVSGLQQTVKGLIDHQSANSNTTPNVPSGDYTPQSFSSGEFSFANPTTTGCDISTLYMRDVSMTKSWVQCSPELEDEELRQKHGERVNLWRNLLITDKKETYLPGVFRYKATQSLLDHICPIMKTKHSNFFEIVDLKDIIPKIVIDSCEDVVDIRSKGKWEEVSNNPPGGIVNKQRWKRLFCCF